MTKGDSTMIKLNQCADKINKFINELLTPGRLGVLYEAASHLIKAGGKRLRPYIVMKSCELVGGDVEASVPFAAAFEFLHNFTLIHDDIMDNDNFRRGVPTVHSQWGLNVAIASGDFLFAKSYEAMTKHSRDMPCSSVKACIERLTDSAIAICEGQILDTTFPDLIEVTEKDYFSMIGGKTAALFKACAEVGAIVGGGDQKEIEYLGGYAWNAGMTFQLVDDYLGAISDEETLGKPVGSDIREGKKTLFIVHALNEASPDEREKIKSVLGVQNASTSDLEEAYKLLIDLGSLDYSQRCAEGYAEEARTMLASFPESEAKKDLTDLIDFFIERTY